MKAKIIIYSMVLSVPLLLGSAVWQINRYQALEAVIVAKIKAQEQQIMENEVLVAQIAALSSPKTIEGRAKNELGLNKKTPQEVLQIWIEGEGY
jgi:cell division protein FtsB